MGIIMQNKRQVNQTQLLYKGSQVLLNEYIQHRILRQEIQQQYPYGKVYYFNLICSLNGKLLKDPLIVRDCLEETRVSFEQFFNLFRQQSYLKDSTKSIIICKCQNCANGITRTDQLAYDEMLAEAIQVYTFQKDRININEKIEYDYLNKKIKQFDSINDEYQQAQQQFKRKLISGKKFQIKEIQTNLLGIIVIQNQEGLFVKNYKEILKQFNDVAESQQFKRWNIKVHSIKATIRRNYQT
ncbi:hypothetical protein pb186bvf_012383 [Paramecium bursaria]